MQLVVQVCEDSLIAQNLQFVWVRSLQEVEHYLKVADLDGNLKQMQFVAAAAHSGQAEVLTTVKQHIGEDQKTLLEHTLRLAANKEQ